MTLQAKPGEAVTDGRNVTIGAPTIRASGAGMNQVPSPPTPAQSLATMIRHLKGVLASAEDLQKALEEAEHKE